MLTMLANRLFNKIKSLVALAFLSSISITLCATKAFSDFSQEKNNIKLSVHTLSNAQMRKLFNCYNPVKIVRLTSFYQAFEITIENKAAQEYVLAQNNIDLKLENNLIIRRKVKTNPVIIPLVATLAASTILISGIGFVVIPSIIFGTALGVTTLNLNMQQSNKFSIKNIRNKVLDPQHPTLASGFSKTQKIIFVASKNIKKQFDISLETLNCTQKITFDVVLKKNI